MMKKILLIFALMFAHVCYGAEMVNVEYVHGVIKQRWGITVPYNPALSNPRVAANMEYLLTAVDVANEMLNGEPISNYGTGEYATHAAADTIATNTAVDTLVQFNPKFVITTTPDTDHFEFSMSASGTFMVDWGDKTPPQVIVRDDTTAETYSHDYATAGKYKIGFKGTATRYSTSNTVAAISFVNSYVSGGTTYYGENRTLAGIDGSLGRLFPTIGDGRVAGQQPRFYRTFAYCSNISGSIPADLFTGVSGQPVGYMFANTFDTCKKLSGDIPKKLFAEITGVPANFMFSATFKGCSGLSGEIPTGLFRGVSGAPAQYMFANVFADCSGLTGKIPAELFAKIDGAPKVGMFINMFRNCSGLSGCIPDGLFSGIDATLNEILTDNTPFAGTNVTQEYCSAIASPAE